MVDWWFRNRRTGRITIAQAPNLSLSIFLSAAVSRWLVSPSGTVAAVIDLIATGALVWWALDEIARGVNPFRRLLGAGVLATQALLLFL